MVMGRWMAGVVALAAASTVGCGGDGAAPAGGATLPSAPVEVIRDERGIPHLYAQNDEDLFFAYGYQLASDRMLQLEMFRRFSHGRLSEVLGADGPGAGADNSLIDDRFARIFNWKHWGTLDAALMKEQEPEHYKLTSAWVDGINKRVDEVNGGAVGAPFGFDEIGIQPEKWTHEDVYIVQKMVGFGLDQTIQYEVMVTFAHILEAPLEAIQLFKPVRDTFAVPPEDRPNGQSAMGGQSHERKLKSGQLPQEASIKTLSRLQHMKALGSNNWAVDGRHTASGKPIIAGDPHLGFGFSGIVYGLHLNSMDAGGTFDVVGFSFVGAPGIFAGHNRRVAYTETSAFSDVMDMWAVEVVDGKANIGGELVETVERVETINIKGAEPDVITVIDVPGYGVVMPASLVGAPPFAGAGKEAMVGWTGFKARPARYFRELMRVNDLDEFEAAVERLPEMSYNFVAADATGISYKVGVDVPLRNTPAFGMEPWRVMDAGVADSLWPEGKFLSAEQKPHSRATERGWIATANNDPFGFTADGLLHNDPWYYGALFPPGWRAGRIEDELNRLTAQGGITVEQMQALQMDTHSNAADDFVPVLAQAHANIAGDADLAEFAGRADLDTLVQLITQDWDRQMQRDSSGAVAFHAFAHFAAKQVLADNLPLLFDITLETAPMYMLKVAALALNGKYPDADAVLEEGRDRVVLLALDATAEWLTERFGGVDPAGYTFSDVRLASMDHAYGRPISLPAVPTDGGESTVNVAQSKFSTEGAVNDTWSQHWGAIERQVMSFDDSGQPQSFANFALGNVADPSSPHFDNAMSDWLNGNYNKLLYKRSEIEAAQDSRHTIPAADQRR